MPVHLYGQLADIERIRSVCLARGLLLLEDAAQAHGARSASVNAGRFGHAGGFSFYPVKNLGALSDAGCIVTEDPELAERVRVLGNYGASRKYEHDFCGSNSRIDELQAAILTIKLKPASDNARRQKIARRYHEGLRNPLVRVPAKPSSPESHVWHLFVATTPHRASLARHLEAEHRDHNSLSPCDSPAGRLSGEDGFVDTPVAEPLQHEVLSLPISQVMDDSQVDYVIEAVNRWPGPQRGDAQMPDELVTDQVVLVLSGVGRNDAIRGQMAEYGNALALLGMSAVHITQDPAELQYAGELDPFGRVRFAITWLGMGQDSSVMWVPISKR